MVKNNQIVAEKVLAKVAYKAAKDNVNATCTCFFYQPKVSKKLLKLRKH